MTATIFRQDGTLKHLLNLLWQAGWDNTIFSLEPDADGSLAAGPCGFQVMRSGFVLGAEQIADGGMGTVVVKVRSQVEAGDEVAEERFTSLEILQGKDVLQRIKSMIRELQSLG